MHAEEPTDLIRLEGEDTSVVLRITGKERRQGLSESLAGEFLIDTPFVRGSLRTWVSPEDLREWRDALDTLDAGEDIAWREEPEMFFEHIGDDEQVHLTIKAGVTAVTVTVSLPDSWFDDAYDRLDLTWKTWSPTED
jgi:hypothetical protein